MARATWIQTNFNGGEWSPLAYGRVDNAKYKNGLALCENWLPTQQGGLTRRPGERFVAYAKDNDVPVRLQAFEFSITQAYMLEFGSGYIRIFANDAPLLATSQTAYAAGTAYVPGNLVTHGGVLYNCLADTTGNAPPNATYWYPLTGTIVEVPTPFSASDIWELGFTQSADTLFISHPRHKQVKFQRVTADNWRLVTIPFLDGPYLPVNATSTKATPASNTGSVVVQFSSNAGINDGAGLLATDVGRSLRIQCNGTWLWGTITAIDHAARQATWDITPPTVPPTTATAVAGVSGGSVFSVNILNHGGGYGVVPPTVTFSGGGGSGAIAYANLVQGIVSSITISVTGTGYTSAPTVTIDPPPTSLAVNPTTFWRLGLWNSRDGYPNCVTFHQDRLCWAGAKNSPNRVDCSNSGDYENMAPSAVDGTVTDSSGLSFSLNAGTVNAIAWIKSDQWGLLIGTAGSEWAVSPSSTQQALTPTNINAMEMSNYGSASNIPPLRAGRSTLFIQRTGRKVRELIYQFMLQTFQALDISLISEHLTKGGIKQLSLQLTPQQIVWMARNDGHLVGMTYDKDQDICGWHRHTLGGFSDAAQTLRPVVESVACIPAPGILRDEVWLASQRYVNGRVIRTIGVMSKIWEDGDDLARCNILDCSAEYSGTPTTTVTIPWLAGQTVGVLTDGAEHATRVADSTGQITLQWPASVVQVGLPYDSNGQTLSIEAGGTDGPSHGKLKRIVRAMLRFFQSIGISVGSDEEGIAFYPESFRTPLDNMDSPIPLQSGDRVWAYEGTYDTEGKVSFSAKGASPATITMLTAMVDTQEAQ